MTDPKPSPPRFVQIGEAILSDDEREECEQFLQSVLVRPDGKRFVVNEDLADDFKNCLIAMCLMSRAERLLLVSHPPDAKEQACSSAAKAFATYSAPIYLYDFACVLQRAGKPDEAKAIFQEFIRHQQSFSPGPVDQMLLKQRDIVTALAHARNELA